MFGRRQRTYEMAPVVTLPTGNVEVVASLGALHVLLPEQKQPADALDTSDDVAAELNGWTIRDSSGVVLRAGLPDRATASRELGVLAAHGAGLPLILYRPDGQPAGERLG